MNAIDFGWKETPCRCEIKQVFFICIFFVISNNELLKSSRSYWNKSLNGRCLHKNDALGLIKLFILRNNKWLMFQHFFKSTITSCDVSFIFFLLKNRWAIYVQKRKNLKRIADQKLLLYTRTIRKICANNKTIGTLDRGSVTFKKLERLNRTANVVNFRRLRV